MVSSTSLPQGSPTALEHAALLAVVHSNAEAGGTSGDHLLHPASLTARSAAAGYSGLTPTLRSDSE